jgi:hypothetical protein
MLYYVPTPSFVEAALITILLSYELANTYTGWLTMHMTTDWDFLLVVLLLLDEEDTSNKSIG